MANLFFIHTPLQLLVSQQIIRQEGLRDNIMLYGYVDNNKHFLQIYELSSIDELWKAKVPMPQVARWGRISRKHLFRDERNAYNNYKYIGSVLRSYKIDTIYLGDVRNMSCQLAAMSFHKKGYKICFFEEGSGHYLKQFGYGVGGSMLDKVFAVLMDITYYLPFFHVPFGYIKYWKGFTFSDLPMDVRYSLVPFYHEPFDKLVIYKPIISSRLSEYLKEETIHLNSDRCVLLLTSPFYINGVDDNPQPYVKTIIDFAKTLKDYTLHIKFHPRETQEVRSVIREQLNKESVPFAVLGEELSIPVEYYLQYIHYNKIVMFLSSTSFYNGYLFPKTEFISIMKDYYENCKKAGSINTQFIQSLVNNI